MAALMESIHPLSMIIQEFQRADEDAYDRLNHKYSTLLFVVLAIGVTANQLVGEVIKCWTPAQFPEAWVEYTSSICWISNTYFLPMSEKNILDDTLKKEVVYYQWVPLALFVQAFGFYFPCVIWGIFKNSLGMNVKKMVAVLTRMEHLNPQVRDESSKFLVKHIHRALRYSREIDEGCFTRMKQGLSKVGCLCGKRYGNLMTIGYLLSKCMYIGNVIAQLYFLKHFLGTEYVMYGVDVLRDMTTNGSFKESARFPRVTLCDFEVRALGKNQWHTVQCTLPVNLFNEKMYVFIWFWLVLVGIATIFGLLSAFSELFLKSRRSFITKYLKTTERYESGKEAQIVKDFCSDYLRQDGHFVLRMLAKNTNDVAIGELIAALWDSYRKQYKAKYKDKEVDV